LKLNSEAVLKSIEVQHGLLVERAKDIYSFSHLTFQEYLSAKRIVNNSDLENLVEHITEKHWREIFLLAAGIMQNADELMLLMKEKIDGLVASDEKLQQFLGWISQKSGLSEFSWQPSALRSFCYGLDKTYDFVRELDNNLTHARNHTQELAYNLVRFLERAHELTCNIHRVLDYDLGRTNDYILAGDLYRTLMSVRQYAHNLALDSELQLILKQLQDSLPNMSYENWSNFQQWWQACGQSWTSRLRDIIEKCKNIEYRWKFSDLQKKLLQQYYTANKLLVDCLNSDCSVSREVRQEIEDTLLLPMAEIEKRKQGKVG
jgi:predicted NACHT family NTPase